MRITVNRALLIVLGLAYLSLSLLRRSFYSPGLVDWKTIEILSSLIVINASLMMSGGIDFLSLKILEFTKDRRQLLLTSIILTSSLAMFLTNDVALLVLVPLTVSIGKFTKKNVEDVIIFQAIAANVGSMLTPFGNPQNIIIYGLNHLNYPQFISNMFPPYLFSMVVLLLFVGFMGNEKLATQATPTRPNYGLFATNVVLLSVVISAMALNLSGWFFIAAIIVSIASLLVIEPAGIVKVDYVLIIVFILIFLVMNSLKLIVRIPVPTNVIEIYILSIIFSQFLSNVPTTVLFGKISSWVPLSYGVNIGGNGTVIASLANLIALRNISGKNFLKFNKYSFLFLLITGAIGLIWLLK